VGGRLECHALGRATLVLAGGVANLFAVQTGLFGVVALFVAAVCDTETGALEPPSTPRTEAVRSDGIARDDGQNAVCRCHTCYAKHYPFDPATGRRR
jgi:hypothetical protein